MTPRASQEGTPRTPTNNEIATLKMKSPTNRELLTEATSALTAILADVKEKNAMMDAGRIGGRYDDFGECETILEDMQTQLDRLDFLL